MSDITNWEFAIDRTPQVSVVIPAYNCAAYVGQACDSVLSQTYTDWEIIVVDDGSKDDTRLVLDKYGDRRVRYVYQENQGVSLARNHGIQLARGEFVAFLDADDFFLPDKLASQIAVFAAQPNLGIVHSGWRLVNSIGEAIKDIKFWQNVPKLDLEMWLRWNQYYPAR